MLRFPGLVMFLLVATACVEIREQPVEVAPGTVPPEIRDASWADLPIPYCTVNLGEGGFVDHATFVTLTQRAFAAWEVPTAYQGDCDGPLVHNNRRNEIGWGDFDTSPDDLTEAGSTNLRYISTLFGGPPDITEADVTIHRTPASGKGTEECLLTTLLHETGHVLGLPHLTSDTVMSPVITDCLQAPTPADLAARDELY